MTRFSVASKAHSFALLFAAYQAIFLAMYFYSTRDGFDFLGFVVERDFANLYLGGKLIGQGQSDMLFLPGQYWGAMREWLGPHYPIHNWSYPPTLFWLAEILSKLPYFGAYTAWTVGGVFLLGVAIRSMGLGWVWVLCIVLSPAGVWNIVAGQNGYYTAALIIFAIQASQMNRKPAAGFFWALASVKPHLGLMAASLLICQKRYGVIISGVVVLSILIMLLLFRYGLDPWRGFFGVTTHQQQSVLERWGGLLLLIIPSGFMQGRLLGIPIPAAYLLHGMVSVITMWLLVRAWVGRRADLRYWITWFTLGTFLLLPYFFVYDLVLFQVVLALWSNNQRALFQMSSAIGARVIWCVIWISPLFLVLIAGFAKMQVMPLILIWMLWRLGKGRQNNAGPQIEGFQPQPLVGVSGKVS